MPLVAELDNWSLIVTFFVSVGFVIGASFIAPWWESVAGRTIVSIDVALGIALGPSTVHHFIPAIDLDSVAFAWYYFVSFCLVSGVTVWRLAMMYLVQRRGRQAAAAAARAAAEAEGMQEQPGDSRGQEA